MAVVENGKKMNKEKADEKGSVHVDEHVIIKDITKNKVIVDKRA